jgi:ubiquitin-protein ligase
MKRLQEDPIPLAAASPCSDNDITLWNGIIGVEISVTHIGTMTVPLHFLIDFPHDYPQSAPNIGFSFEFPYRGGAEYVMREGRLEGKKVICLDVLGNFQGVHTEWKNEVGSGWSPAYTVTTLLVQLQSVLCSLGADMSQRERDVCYQSAVRFCEKNPAAVLEILDEDDIRERREKQRFTGQVAKICDGDAEMSARVEGFAKKVGLLEDGDNLASFLSLLCDFKNLGSSIEVGSTAASSSCDQPTVDSNICCFATGRLYTEALLGVGVSRERKNLATAGELVSKDAFDDGLRQGTNKAYFEFFLPVWINAGHAEKHPEWCMALMKSCKEIGEKALGVYAEDQAIVEVFSRLINQMIVEMMRPDAAKSEAIATFEAMCNFWRTFRWLVDTRSALRSQLLKTLSNFVRGEAFRHKDATPDLGAILVMYTVFQGYEGCPTRQQFVDAYVDENSVRWVMWWQKAGTKPEAAPVFEATKVSREIFMFQMMVVDLIIGSSVTETLDEIEKTNCKLPARLEKLQSQWRTLKSETKDWQMFFQCTKASRPTFPSSAAWIADCVQRAAAKGPKYGGQKGDGKGHRKSEGKGKGGGKKNY